MKQSERNDLVRLVKARFKILRDQAVLRSYEIYMQEQRVAKSGAYDRADDYRSRFGAIVEQMQPMLRQLDELMREIGRDEDVYASGRWGGPRVDIEVQRGMSRRVSWDNKLSFVDKYIITELDLAELAMIEEILVAGIEGSEAKKMLDRIPTVEQLVKGEVKLTEIAPSMT